MKNLIQWLVIVLVGGGLLMGAISGIVAIHLERKKKNTRIWNKLLATAIVVLGSGIVGLILIMLF